jgi:hypothetical protein
MKSGRRSNLYLTLLQPTPCVPLPFKGRGKKKEGLPPLLDAPSSCHCESTLVLVAISAWHTEIASPR